MNHVTTQTLQYKERSEEVKAIADVLDLIQEGQIDEAKRRLVILHAALLAAQTPRLVQYNPLEARV